MHHSFIAPTKYLDLIPQTCTYHLMLAHLMKDPEYCNFYRQRSQDGDFIIIDNGAFENGTPYSLQEIATICEDACIVPNIVVAPDYPYQDWKKTYESAVDSDKIFNILFDARFTQLMIVPQSVEGDIDGWIRGYGLASQLSNVEFIGLSIIGMPNAFCKETGTDDITFNRQYGINKLKQLDLWEHNVKHHALGCGSPREIKLLKTQRVFGNDSSTAIWHGIQKTKFDQTQSGLIDGKSKIEVDFDFKFYSNRVPFIEHNVKWINNLLGD